MPLAKLYEIFRAQPRYTEPAERHRPLQKRTDPNGKKDHSDAQEQEDTLFGEDQMEVSIQSLKAFFAGLLKQQDAGHIPPEKTQHDQTQFRGNPPTTKAVNAYRHAAETAPEPFSPEQTPPKTSPENQETAPSEITVLDKAEQEKIRGLLELLDKLEAQSITNITLEPASRFLDSVENAIKKKLQD